MNTFAYVLFPGRHHLLTRFQVAYLQALLAGTVRDTAGQPVTCAADARVVWAVTSANHHGTRRNPLPGSRREALIERVTAAEQLPSVVVPVPDVPTHPRFAHLVATTCATELGVHDGLTPDNTVVACSTPQVATDYTALGYRVVPVEADPELPATPPRPWDLVVACASGDPAWADLAHPEVGGFYTRYGLQAKIAALFADPVASDEGDLTTTRDYRTYAAAFERASDRKWELVGPHIQPGRIVDIGCASGGLLERVAGDDRLRESDLFGIDIARPLLTEAEHKKATGVFANPNIWFVRANILTTDVMPERSVDTTTSIALTHEVFSYGHGRDDVATFARRIFTHTRPGGVWVNSDVLGPDDPDRLVDLRLATDDGVTIEAPRTDLDQLSRAEVAAYTTGLATAGKFVQFGYDFPRLSGASWKPEQVDEGVWRLRLADAMEFLETKDYTDNWLSECHEQFTALTFADWQDLLNEAGFDVDPISAPSRNDWLVQHRFTPVAALTDATTKDPVDWPHTHVLTVARRPLL